MTDELHGQRDVDETAADLTNEELRDRFVENVRDNTKPNTARFYRRNIDRFRSYVEDRGGHLTEDVGARDIREYLRQEAEDYAPKTVRHRYSTISRFYNTLRGELQLIPIDERVPIDSIKPRKLGSMGDTTMTEASSGDEFHYLTSEEVDKLVEHVPEPALRNRAMVMLMANTGMRASEVSRVCVGEDCLNLDKKKLTVKSPKLSGTNAPEMVTYYWRSEAVSDAINAWQELGRPTNPYADESEYLFPSKQSERVKRKRVNEIVKDAAENAGLQSPKHTDAAGNERVTVTSHVLRHSYAMAALRNGMNIDEIQDCLHHTNIETTMKYLRHHEEDKARAVERHGPQFG